MKQNMGTTDRAIRVLIAILLIGLFLGNVISGTIGIVLLVVAGVFILTSAVGHCPLYTIFGIRTCRLREKSI